MWWNASVSPSGSRSWTTADCPGHFDFELTWTPGLPTASDTGPDIFEALRDQLGLKLESTTASEEVWIVDHVERPSPD